MGEADRAGALGRVPGGGAELRNLGSPADAGEVDSRGARLEQAIDEAAISSGDPRERRKPERAAVPDEAERLNVGELRVLEVDDGKIEARRAREVDDLGRRELDEQASDTFAEIQHL
jgi:hypothetical protein